MLEWGLLLAKGAYTGKKLKKKFFDALPAFKTLYEAVKHKAKDTEAISVG